MSKIDITRGIKLGGFDYCIDMSQGAKLMLIGNNHSGEYSSLAHTISIVHDLDDVAISQTFIHEVVEAVNHVYCDDGIEHSKISQLAFGIHQVMESLGVRFGGSK